MLDDYVLEIIAKRRADVLSGAHAKGGKDMLSLYLDFAVRPVWCQEPRAISLTHTSSRALPFWTRIPGRKSRLFLSDRNRPSRCLTSAGTTAKTCWRLPTYAT